MRWKRGGGKEGNAANTREREERRGGKRPIRRLAILQVRGFRGKGGG